MSEFEKELEKSKSYDRRLPNYYHEKILIKLFKDWQPPKPLVVVPQIVDEFIEEAKGDYTIYGAFTKLSTKMSRTDIGKWVFASKERQMLFARAWLDGYAVEKEKLFYLKNKITGNRLYKQPKEAGSNLVEVIDCLHKSSMMFTQQEIDDMETGSYEQIAVTFEEVEK